MVGHAFPLHPTLIPSILADYASAGTYMFYVPAGKTVIWVELWGAGGGGAGGSGGGSETLYQCAYTSGADGIPGGRGKRGGYVSARLEVSPGQMLTIFIGAGGAPGPGGSGGVFFGAGATGGVNGTAGGVTALGAFFSANGGSPGQWPYYAGETDLDVGGIGPQIEYGMGRSGGRGGPNGFGGTGGGGFNGTAGSAGLSGEAGRILVRG